MLKMESTPICRCRVLYLGSAVPQQSKDGLQGIQEPLRELYPEKGATTGGIDSWLSVWSNGILLENVDESGSRVSRFFPISSLHYCAAVRRVSVEGAPRFLPLDSPFARAPAPRRPPLFAAVLRRTQGIKVLECHAFICRREAAANALVRCCFHAYADSSYAKRLEAERSPSQLPPEHDEEVEVFDGDENHKVWVGEIERDDASDDIPHPTRAPRPRQITRPASVPPPPPPPEEPKKKTLSKKSKKKSSASADELYATMPGPAALMNGRSLGRAPPAWAAAGHPMVLVAHPAATLPHARPATMGHRGRLPAALAPGPFPPVPPPGRGRIQYATVDPRRSKPPPSAMKAAQSMTGLEAVEDSGGIYRKKGHLNERAFSYSIRQEHRSRSHGSLANLKFAAPPEVINMAKKIYNSWKQDDMDEALQQHRDGKLGFNEACRLYSIPKPTFRRHLRGLNKTSKFGRPNDMTTEMENELAQHILNMESAFFGLTVTNVRKLAYQFAEKYKLPHRFNKEKEIAGKKWFARFMKEHPILSLRVPEPTSMARSKGFNKERVNDFFDKYEEILEKHMFTADKVYNVDETALSTVHKPSKIIAQKGKHQVGALTSGERGLTTTCVCAMNAAGEYIPPMLIYKRVRMLEMLKRGAPPNTLFGCSKNGWITSELFVQWLQHFIKCTKLEKSDQKQILLLLDGHSTHTKNLEAIELARDYGIVMLSFPAHTTHRLQPLDRSFFKSLKSSYNQAASSWLRSNPGAVIKQGNIAELLGKAYPRSVRMDIAQNGFRATGLWPSDRNIFTEEDFISSVQIDDQGPTAAIDSEPPAKSIATPATREAPATPPMSGISTPLATDTRPEIGITPAMDRPTSSASEMTPQNGTPPVTTKPPVARTPTTTAKSPMRESPQPGSSRIDDPTNKKQIMASLNIISPIPSLTKVDQKMRKGTNKTAELTSSPYKTEIETKEKTKKLKRPILNLKNIKKQKGTQVTNKKRKIDTKSNKDKKLDAKENWLCKLCNEDRKENMTQCIKCKGWVHDLCADLEIKTKNYICDICI